MSTAEVHALCCVGRARRSAKTHPLAVSCGGDGFVNVGRGNFEKRALCARDDENCQIKCERRKPKLHFFFWTFHTSTTPPPSPPVVASAQPLSPIIGHPS